MKKPASTKPKKAPSKTRVSSKQVSQKNAGPGKVIPAEAPILPFETSAAWNKWLTKNFASTNGVWMKIAKKDTGVRSISAAEALELALIWGWIDGQRNGLDETYFLQRYTPRRANSMWSQINRDKALQLIADNKMQPSGLAEVERAKKDGRWERAYAPIRSNTVPDDLRAALDENPRAKKFFESLDSRNRFSIVFRLGNVKKEATRLRKLGEYVAMLERGEKLIP